MVNISSDTYRFYDVDSIIETFEKLLWANMQTIDGEFSKGIGEMLSLYDVRGNQKKQCLINAVGCLRQAVNTEKNLNLIFVLTAVSMIAYILGDREAGERVLVRLRKTDLASDKISFWEKIINHIGNDPSQEFHEIKKTLESFIEQVDSFCSKNPINWSQQNSIRIY